MVSAHLSVWAVVELPESEKDPRERWARVETTPEEALRLLGLLIMERGFMRGVPLESLMQIMMHLESMKQSGRYNREIRAGEMVYYIREISEPEARQVLDNENRASAS